MADTLELKAASERDLTEFSETIERDVKRAIAAPGQLVGYLRVSSVDQNTARQLDGLRLDKVFTDRASAKDAKRPELAALRSYVREGDTLIVHSMDRLARNVDDLRAIVRELTDRGVKVQFVREALTFTGEDSPLSNLLLSVLGAVAQFERDLIRERQREGVELAKRRGAYKGRARKFTAAQAQELARRVAAGESPTKLARELNVSPDTIYRAREAAKHDTAEHV
jgi:DNA invertase Pin-like site-specific DNA recombinase